MAKTFISEIFIRWKSGDSFMSHYNIGLMMIPSSFTTRRKDIVICVEDGYKARKLCDVSYNAT